MLMVQEVMSQHSRDDCSTDVEFLGRLLPEVFFFPKVGWDLKKYK